MKALLVSRDSTLRYLIVALLAVLLAAGTAAAAGIPAELMERAVIPAGSDGSRGVLRGGGFDVNASDASNEFGVEVTWTAAPMLDVYFVVERDGVPLTQLSAQDSVWLDTDVHPRRVHEYGVVMRDANTSFDLLLGSDSGSRGFFGPRNADGTLLELLDGVQITWEDRSEIEDGFIIFRDGAPLDTTAANVSVYVDSNVDSLTTHEYCVSAYVTDGTEATGVGSVAMGNSDPHLAMWGDYAFVSDSASRLGVVDVSDPTNPAVTQVVNDPDGRTGGPVVFDPALSVLVVCGDTPSVTLYDVFDPYNPVSIGMTALTGVPTAMDREDGTIYITTDDDVLNVSVFNDIPLPIHGQIAIPAFVNTYPTDVVAAGGFAYVSAGSTGVVIVNAQDPVGTPLAIVGQQVMPNSGSWVHAVEYLDEHLFALADDSLYVYRNISPPGSTPVLVHEASAPVNGGTELTVADSHLYVSGGAQSVRTYDVSNPAAPVLQSGAFWSGGATETAVRGDYAYSVSGGLFEVTALPGDAQTAHTCTLGSRTTVEVPTDVAATFGYYLDKTVVSWTDNSEVEAGYRIVRPSPFQPELTVDVGPDVTSWEDTDPSVEQQVMSYSVYALDADGNALLGGTAQGAFGADMMPGVEGDYGEALRFGPLSDVHIRIEWDPVGAEDSYVIWRRPGKTIDPFAAIDTVAAGTTEYEDAAPTPQDQWEYRVTVLSAAGGNSNLANATGILAWQETILQPADVTASDGAYEDHVHVTWENQSTKTVYFEILRDGTVIQTVAGHRRAADDYGAEIALPSDQAYGYEVRAVSATGEKAGAGDSGYRSLTPPSGVAASDFIDEDHVLVTWNDDSRTEAGYRIYRKYQGVTTLIDSVGVNRTAYLDVTGESQTTYEYLVAAHDAQGESARDSDFGGRAIEPPTNVVASDSAYEDRVVVEWDDNSGVETGYRVTRFPAMPAPGYLPPNATAFTDTTVTLGTTYTYSVTAYDDFGFSELVHDDGNSAMLAPGSVNATTSDEFGVTLTWTDESEINTNYVVTRNGGVLSNSLGADATSYVDNTVAGNGNVYDYCVWALSSGTGVTSDTVCVSGSSPPATNLGYNAGWVTNLEASDGDFDSRVRLTWTDARNGEDEIEIYRDGQLIDTVGPNVTTYNDTEAKPGQAHRYRVRALDTAAPDSSGWDFDIGYRPPDGSITGRVTTRGGAPVESVTVVLEPSLNKSMMFDGQVSAAYVGHVTENPTTAFTVEFWMKSSDRTKENTVFSYLWDFNRDDLAVKVKADQITVEAANQAVTIGTPNLHDGEWHHIAVTAQASSQPTRLYIDGAFYGSAAHWPGGSILSDGVLWLGVDVESIIENATYFPSQSYHGLLDELRVWNYLRSEAEIQADMSHPLRGDEQGLVWYYPFDEGGGGGVTDQTGTGHNGALRPGTYWSSDAAPIDVASTTDVEGNFALNGIRYGTSTTFTVTPTSPNGLFDPEFKTITLDTQSPVQNEVFFNDVTAYNLEGTVAFQGTSCTQEGVEIWLNGELAGATRSDGTFTVSAQPGSYEIAPRRGTDTFLPDRRTIVVSADTANLDFANTTTNTLSGFAGGGCGLSIGTLVFNVTTPDGCLNTQISTDSDYSLSLPPQRYLVTYDSYDGTPPFPLSEGDILQHFQNMGSTEVDLSTGDVELDLLYRAPLSIEITGMPAVVCSTFTDPESGRTIAGAPVLAQSQSVTFGISVFEDYGTEGRCPVDSGTITVFDEIQDVSDSPVVLPIVNGVAAYTTVANTPNVAQGRMDAGGNDRSFQKAISFVAEAPGADLQQKTLWALVTGSRPRVGTFVSATTEEFPLLILRDPPGDGSRAFLSEGTTFTYTTSQLGVASIDGTAELSAKSGVQFEAGTPFFSTDTEVAVTVSRGWEIGARASAEGGVEFSLTTTEEFSTSTEEVFVGESADLFLGIAMNLIFAKADDIAVDTQTCRVLRSQSVRFGADKDAPFETVYFYTDAHITNNVVPRLQELALLQPDRAAEFTSYASNWSSHLAFKDSLTTEALAGDVVNRSFSSGADFEYSTTADTTRSFAWETGVYSSEERALEFAFEAGGVGYGGKLAAKLTFEAAAGGSADTTTSRTVGYSFSDNDPGDFFTIDVAKDPVYGTPVFATRSGTSACPLEAGTQPRDRVSMDVEPFAQADVPADGLAEFILSIKNDSQSGEAREYQLRAVQTSNPHGAVLRVNGSPLDRGLSFFIAPGTTQTATLTVQRGPSRFFYDGLAVMVVAPCEYALWEAGGTLAVSDTIRVDVAFASPCSDVTMLAPRSGWTFTQDDSASTGNVLEVLLDDFQLTISETDSIDAVGAEYRRAGTETWFEIGRVGPENIQVNPTTGDPLAVSVDWDLSSIADGQYQIRPFTVCENGRVAGEKATGRIDRKQPQVFGEPQPADGVLVLGDEISISFSEPIDCSSVDHSSVVLERLGGGNPIITTSLVCNGSKVVVQPVSPPLSLLEGQTLQATVSGIRDVVGNTLAAPEIWSFVVQRNGFAWAQASVATTTGYLEPGEVSATLVNGTGAAVDFTLYDVAPWLMPSAVTGTIANGGAFPISFEIADTLLVDSTYVDTLYAAVGDTLAPVSQAALEVRVAVLCSPEAGGWSVDPSDYEYSMTAVMEVRIGGSASTDSLDLVAGFVGNEIRGVANVRFVPETGRHVAFMNIFSNRTLGENVRFRVFDASECVVYGATDRFFRFEADRRYGTADDPEIVNAVQAIPGTVQTVGLNPGWTWFSLHVEEPLDMSVQSILGDLTPSESDLIKSQTQFAQFDEELGWVGSLTEMNVRESYAIKVAEQGSIVHVGIPATPDIPIPLVNGWNWVGYPPATGQDVNAALANLQPFEADVVKSQLAFAAYDSGSATWVGTMPTMEPGRGYRLYAAAGTGQWLVYPSGPGPVGIEPVRIVAADDRRQVRTRGHRAVAGASTESPDAENPLAFARADGGRRPDWVVPRGHQYNMTVTAVIRPEGGTAAVEGGLLGAFVDGELRGVAALQAVPSLDEPLAFLMIQTDVTTGEEVSFRYYDPERDTVLDVGETLTVVPDRVGGSLRNPMAFHPTGGADGPDVPETNGSSPLAFALSPHFPNPTRQGVNPTIRWALPNSVPVRIRVFDVAGREVTTLVDETMPAGWHERKLPTARMASGLYFYRLEAGGFTATRRLTILK